MSTQGSLGGGFDFDTQSGIAHLLASVRASEISVEQKNDLRDTIFLYTNGGRDQGVRIALEQKLASYAIMPAAKKAGVTTQPPAQVSPMGHSRSAPSFVAPAFSAAPAPTPQPAPTPTPAPQAAPQPVATPVPQPTPVAQAPVTPPAPVAPPVAPQPPVASAPVAGSNPEVYLQRIREIKSLVNQKVGNPVNLVDIDNEVGREYMGSLLDAMKKINSGASAISAMQRLEAAFVSVEKAIEGHDAGVIDTPVPEVTPVAPPQAVPVSTPPPPPVQPTPVAPTAVPPVPPPAPVSQSTPVPQPAPIQDPQANRVPIQEIPTIKPDEAQSPDMDEARWTNSAIIKPTPAENKPQESTIPVPPTAPAEPVAPITPVPSLADKQDKPSVQPVETEKPASNDPLFTPEIDNGLDQLLSEWSIFKKSGLFGTGPKGKEHPLFKKIAGLQIPLLLAGRFEGATQEIKQSITDYMNGWRYEQGIVYNQGETFEKYLRRVIKHILDLQKKKLRS